MISEIISEILYDPGNDLRNYNYMILEIISEILYHLRSYLRSFISSQKYFYIISETILEILKDLGNYLLGSPFSAFVDDIGLLWRSYTFNPSVKRPNIISQAKSWLLQLLGCCT